MLLNTLYSLPRKTTPCIGIHEASREITRGQYSTVPVVEGIEWVTSRVWAYSPVFPGRMIYI
jgi:hypothetical protein